jgi:glycosyltransferase involved in cell wall biosynthesis
MLQEQHAEAHVSEPGGQSVKETNVRIVAVIPAFNEAKNIAGVVIGAQKHVSEVVVCDDGSSDLTGEIAEKLGSVVITHKTNLGKGVAIKDLFRRAKENGAEIIVTLDGDGQHDPHQIPLLTKPIIDGTADIVNGSRFLKENAVPGHRRVGDGVLNRMTNAVSDYKLTDTQSGFRAYSRSALEHLEVKEHGIAVDSQLLMEASESGLRVTEVPIDVNYNSDSSTYHPAKHGVYVALSILRAATERSPLLYLGVPGIIFALSGIIVSIHIVDLYNTSRYFSIPFSMLALGFFMVGILLILGAVMLYAINNLVVRLRAG